MIAELRQRDAFFRCALLHLAVVGLCDLLTLFGRVGVAHFVAHRVTLLRRHQLLAGLLAGALVHRAVAALALIFPHGGLFATLVHAHALHVALPHVALHLLLATLLCILTCAVAHPARVGVGDGGEAQRKRDCGGDFGECFHDVSFASWLWRFTLEVLLFQFR